MTRAERKARRRAVEDALAAADASRPSQLDAWDRRPMHLSEAEDEWQVDAPSPLDLAVQRANEVADKYPPGAPWKWSVALADFRELMDLFRAAR